MKRLGTLCLLLMLAIVSRADGFKDFSVIVNNQDGTLLTAEEQVQGTAIDFYVDAVDGVTTREIPADGTAAGHVSGKFHSEHGCTNLQVQAYEASNVKITVGQCTYSPATITVTDAAGNVVATKTPNGPGCWKNDKNNADVLYYTGEATTLTITGMDYCPFVAVSALTEEEIAALNAEYTQPSTQSTLSPTSTTTVRRSSAPSWSRVRIPSASLPLVLTMSPNSMAVPSEAGSTSPKAAENIRWKTLWRTICLSMPSPLP